MIFKVVISSQVEKDLRGIFEYIAFELLSPENATGQLERLEKQILHLKKYQKSLFPPDSVSPQTPVSQDPNLPETLF